MNETNIEKLNGALLQLIEAYEQLQGVNSDLEKKIEDLESKNAELETQKSDLEIEKNDLISKNEDLEYRLNDFSENTEQQETKMDGMLSKIQSLLQGSKEEAREPIDRAIELASSNVELKDVEQDQIGEDHEETSILDIKLDHDEDSSSVSKEEEKDDASEDTTTQEGDSNPFSKSNKVDLGRMESLLNGLNK